METDYAQPIQEPIGALEFRGALVLAEVFKVAAGVVGVLGILAGIVLGAGAGAEGEGGTSDRVVFSIALILASLLAAAAIAFLGYVLSILVGIYSQVWESRFPDQD